MDWFQKISILFIISISLVSGASWVSAVSFPQVPILMYHYIGNNPNLKDKARDVLSVSPDKFDSQMGYLAAQGYTPITLDTLYGIYNGKAQSPAKPIILTFDDGYIDFYLNAFPILRKYGFHAVSFIPTGLMNQGYYMSWAQIKEIQSSGLVTFEAHSVTHSNLVSLDNKRLLFELSESKRVLEVQTGYPVNFIAYPYGASNSNVQMVAKQVGFVGGLGSWSGKASGQSMNMRRLRISGRLSLQGFTSLVR